MDTQVTITEFCKEDRGEGFDCGESELNKFFYQKASQYNSKNLARIYFLKKENEKNAIGFYTLSAGEIQLEKLPTQLYKSVPRLSSVPIIRIGRLAVINHLQVKGLGSFMMKDAINRCCKISDIAGVFGIVVDAKNERVKRLYKRLGFQELPEQTNTLILQISVYRKSDISQELSQSS